MQGYHGSHKVIGKDIHVKECRHSRILFRWKLEFLGEAWKNQGLGFTLSTFLQKPKFKTSSLNLKVFLAKRLSPSRHP
jgi:hypothetical protein